MHNDRGCLSHAWHLAIAFGVARWGPGSKVGGALTAKSLYLQSCTSSSTEFQSLVPKPPNSEQGYCWVSKIVIFLEDDENVLFLRNMMTYL